MSTLVYLAGLAVIGIVAVVAAAPLLRGRDAGQGRGPASGHESGRVSAAVGSERHRLEKEKELAYGAIKEAEFDFQMGKLSPEDYAALREKYAARALEALEALERLS